MRPRLLGVAWALAATAITPLAVASEAREDGRDAGAAAGDADAEAPSAAVLPDAAAATRPPPPPAAAPSEAVVRPPPRPPEPAAAGRSAAEAEEQANPQELAPRANAKGDPFGDEDEGIKAGGFSFRLLLQTRYTDDLGTLPASSANKLDGFQLNRAFLRGVARPFKWLSAKLLVDFAEIAYSNPQQAVKLAYGEIKPNKRLEFTVGLFKRTYSLLELLPIAAFEFADTGPTDNLIKDTQFAGRDVGIMLRAEPLPKRRWLHAYFGAFGGAGEGAESGQGGTSTVHTGPDLAAPNLLLTTRVASRPIKHLDIAVDGGWRPSGTSAANLPPQSQVTAGKAMSADVTYSTASFELRSEWLWGDRTDAFRVDARTFMAAWGIVAVRFPIVPVVVMPAARFEWLDADREHPEPQRYLISGALNVDFTEKMRLLIDVSRYALGSGTYPLSSPPGLFARSATVLVVQLQLKI